MENYNYLSPKYDRERAWIREALKHNLSWEEIEFGKGTNDDELKEFLKYQIDSNFWNKDINIDIWKEIVNVMKNNEN